MSDDVYAEDEELELLQTFGGLARQNQAIAGQMRGVAARLREIYSERARREAEAASTTDE